MKKNILFYSMLILAVALFFGYCGDDEATKTEDGEKTAETAMEKAEEAAAPAPVVLDFDTRKLKVKEGDATVEGRRKNVAKVKKGAKVTINVTRRRAYFGEGADRVKKGASFEWTADGELQFDKSGKRVKAGKGRYKVVAE